jgi:hypothetical protein
MTSTVKKVLKEEEAIKTKTIMICFLDSLHGEVGDANSSISKVEEVISVTLAILEDSNNSSKCMNHIIVTVMY